MSGWRIVQRVRSHTATPTTTAAPTRRGTSRLATAPPAARIRSTASASGASIRRGAPGAVTAGPLGVGPALGAAGAAAAGGAGGAGRPGAGPAVGALGARRWAKRARRLGRGSAQY